MNRQATELRIQSKSAGISTLGLFVLSALIMGMSAVPGAGFSPAAVSTPATAWQGWMGADGKPLPFESEEDVLEFLRTAKVVTIEDIPRGVTHPRKVVLEKDGIRMNACFRDVDIFKPIFRDPRTGPKRNFRDYHGYECAAYELSRLIGLDKVPPVVPRTINRTKGTLQAWVENAMLELDRQKKKIQPPNRWRWMMESQLREIFDQLIGNDDRNQGNLLIDRDWCCWLIDHTRAFRSFTKLRKPEVIRYCERRVWERLQNLDETEISERLSPFLNEKERNAVMKRRAALVKHIQHLIDERGEGKVLFSFPALPEASP
jgi:hypothetical protein